MVEKVTCVVAVYVKEVELQLKLNVSYIKSQEKRYHILPHLLSQVCMEVIG